MKVVNLWGEERILKHEKLFEVWSNFNNSIYVNAPNAESAILKFKEICPKVRSLIEAKETTFPKGADITQIVEVEE